MTLMERLQRLEHAPTAAEVVRSDGIQQLAGDFAGYGTADSLVTLLTQALRAGDKVRACRPACHGHVAASSCWRPAVGYAERCTSSTRLRRCSSSSLANFASLREWC